jgi:hypothetical protein
MRKWWRVPTSVHFIDQHKSMKTPKPAAAHNPIFQNFILFERFQIALPLNRIGIILRAD